MFVKGLEKVIMLFVVISGVTLILMVCMITLDVFMRYVLNRPLPATVEISTLMEPYVIFLSLAFALAIGGHIRVTLIVGRIKGRLKIFFDAIAYGATLVFICLLAYWSWLHFWESFAEREVMDSVIILPWWVGKFAMPLGLFLMILECIRKLILVFSHTSEKEEIE